MQFADPRTDFVFKRVFGNEKAKEVLISFLNAVLGLEGSRAITDVHILDPYQAPKVPSLKHSFLDVKCRDNRGIEFVVEMQIEYVEGMKKRIQFNACKAYVGQLASGQDYPKLNQVIGISILDFTMFRDFRPLSFVPRDQGNGDGQLLLGRNSPLLYRASQIHQNGRGAGNAD
jgi:predicted transposase/invertase (TIGR01784 family)